MRPITEVLEELFSRCAYQKEGSDVRELVAEALESLETYNKMVLHTKTYKDAFVKGDKAYDLIIQHNTEIAQNQEEWLGDMPEETFQEKWERARMK